MTQLPITKMTLYKHGVGFFERQAQFEGEEITLSFRTEEMNDILKSLTAIDWGSGQVLGVDYGTPQSVEEKLAGCSIQLGDRRSMQDLIIGLRGRSVKLLLDQAEVMSGVLLGIDDVYHEQPLATALVSLLVEGTTQVQTVSLGRVQGVEVIDEKAANDLKFFLQTSLSQENYRQVTVRLTEGEHDLSVSYVAPAPTWRVSYRLVADPEAEDGEQALLLGWGIFDNRMEEDLQGIALSLVAGQPISFVYDLYTPFTPERPVVEEEARVAAGPVNFAGGLGEDVMLEEAAAMPPAPMKAMAMGASASRGKRSRRMSREQMRSAAPVNTEAESLGELFQYNIATPVTVGRGQSAMVPIVSTDLAYRKELIYNGGKMPVNPVATLRMENRSGLTLERGPVTVIEGGEYVGEAILPFTAEGAELIVPYAVELRVRVQESSGSRREIHRLQVVDGYLLIEEWEIRWREYQANNSGSEEMAILVEHARNANYELVDGSALKEKAEGHLRFGMVVPGRGETTLQVQEKRLLSRREDLQRQSYVSLQRYLRRGLLDRKTHDALAVLLGMWEKIKDYETQLKAVEQERQKIYQAQKQIQGNMGALASAGREGDLRSRYVNQLAESEEHLKQLSNNERDMQKAITQLQEQIEQHLANLGK